MWPIRRSRVLPGSGANDWRTKHDGYRGCARVRGKAVDHPRKHFAEVEPALPKDLTGMSVLGIDRTPLAASNRPHSRQKSVGKTSISG